MAQSISEIQELRASVKSLLEIWMRIKLAMQKAFGKDAITKDHENVFLKLKSDLSRTHRTVHERLPKGLQYDGDDMMEMMKNATSMGYLQTLPVTEKRNIFSKWHKVYVFMSRTFGALEVNGEGYLPSLHRDVMTPKPKSGRGKKKKRKARR